MTGPVSVVASSVRAMATNTGTSRTKPARTAFACTECGYAAAKWVGRCPECQTWGSLSEAGRPALLRKVTAGPVTTPARPMREIDASAVAPRPSGLGELDRVLGGGLVPDGVILLAGEPGVGK